MQSKKNISITILFIAVCSLNKDCPDNYSCDMITHHCVKATATTTTINPPSKLFKHRFFYLTVSFCQTIEIFFLRLQYTNARL